MADTVQSSTYHRPIRMPRFSLAGGIPHATVLWVGKGAIDGPAPRL